ncbi:MAG: hypothetical protein PHV51_04440, partial [Methanosarcinaceae archaeon]|nr:hypothetical protein [Methanosarcinaceae archaeon]
LSPLTTYPSKSSFPPLPPHHLSIKKFLPSSPPSPSIHQKVPSLLSPRTPLITYLQKTDIAQETTFARSATFFSKHSSF